MCPLAPGPAIPQLTHPVIQSMATITITMTAQGTEALMADTQVGTAAEVTKRDASSNVRRSASGSQIICF
jgi:hypothetical protein